MQICCGCWMDEVQDWGEEAQLAHKKIWICCSLLTAKYCWSSNTTSRLLPLLLQAGSFWLSWWLPLLPMLLLLLLLLAYLLPGTENLPLVFVFCLTSNYRWVYRWNIHILPPGACLCLPLIGLLLLLACLLVWLLAWCLRLRICLLCESKITAETWDCLPQSQMSGISAVSQSCAVYIEWESSVCNRYFPFIAHEQWSRIGWFGRTWRQNIETTKRLLLLQTLWALQKVCSVPKPTG